MENSSRKQKAPLIYAIVGVAALIVAVAGSTYAFYASTVTSNEGEVQGTAGGGALPTMTITKVSTQATGNLIPIDMDVTTLNAAAAAEKQCVDKNDYTACQVYSVTIKNNSTVAQAYNINLTDLTGTNTPYINAVTMGKSANTVTSANSIKENGLICTTDDVSAGGTSAACYFMVFVANQSTAQTDSGVFNGTVTASSTVGGGQIKADFS